MISFYKGERLLGSDSNALMGRKPELSFAKMNRMLGRSLDHPLVQEVLNKQYFPYATYTNETTGATCLKVDEPGVQNTYYSPEELMAMMLQHAKDMTHNFGGNVIKDCVITVPSSFTQHEKMALYTAADIADLRVLTLIEENTAAALHYGIDRVAEQPNTVIFYNLGANSVQVSIVTYSSYLAKEAGKNKTIGQLEVVGKAWDNGVGGFHFDVRLAEVLALRFNEAWNKKAKSSDNDLRQHVRPMTRLRQEANKVKEVLSANNEYPVKAEQLHADVDLVTKVTRADFEEACADLFSRLTAPIDAALAMANMTLGDVGSVELLGGGLRIPKIKKILDDYFKTSKLELGQHLNGDEAMALGAAFRAANLSTAFRVRKVGVADISSLGVSVKLETLPSDAKAGGGFFGLGRKKEEKGEGEWHKETALFPKKSPVPSKTKAVSFQHDSDILCRLEYDDDALPPGTDSLIAVYNITGIAEFAKETSAKGLGSPKVHLSFLLDGNGVVTLARAEASVELPVEEEKAEEASDNSTATEPAKAASAEEAPPAAEESSDATATAQEGDKAEGDKAEGDKKAAKKKEKKAAKKKEKKDNQLRRVLAVTENPRMLRPLAWTPAQVSESKSRLRALNAADDKRKAKEAALNDLEAYIYRVKNRISDDEEALKAVSTEEQRSAVVALASATEDWLYDEGRGADIAAFSDKHTDLRDKAEAIFKRFSELKDRPAAVALALETLKNVTARVATWAEKMPHVTEEEKASLAKSIDKAAEWINGKVGEQAKASPFDAPVFDSADVPLQLKAASVIFEKLLRKPKPAPEKPKAAANETAAGNSTSAADNSTEPVRVTVNEDAAEPAAEDAEKTEGEEL